MLHAFADLFLENYWDSLSPPQKLEWRTDGRSYAHVTTKFSRLDGFTRFSYPRYSTVTLRALKLCYNIASLTSIGLLQQRSHDLYHVTVVQNTEYTTLEGKFTADSCWAFNGLTCRVRCHSWLITLQGKISVVAWREWRRSVWEKARCRLFSLFPDRMSSIA